MQFNGKLVTMLLLGVALAAALFAWWFQFSRGHRSLEYWEGENAAVIRHGNSAELLELAAPQQAADQPADDSLNIEGESYTVSNRVSLDDAPGFVHARHALIDDASYHWQQTPEEPIRWTHALRFENEAGQHVTVVIALDTGWLKSLEGDRPLAMSEILQSGLKQFFAEHLEQERGKQETDP